MTVEEKITEILSRGYEAHYMLKKVLSDETMFVKNDEILDVIFIRREKMDSPDFKSRYISPTKVLVATTNEILIMEEGLREIDNKMRGYRMRKIYYNKISSLELDISFLKGEFKIITSSDNDVVVEFDTSKYYKQFEKLIECIHDNIV